jgi:hypothetical protein
MENCSGSMPSGPLGNVIVMYVAFYRLCRRYIRQSFTDAPHTLEQLLKDDESILSTLFGLLVSTSSVGYCQFKARCAAVLLLRNQSSLLFLLIDAVPLEKMTFLYVRKYIEGVAAVSAKKTRDIPFISTYYYPFL